MTHNSTIMHSHFALYVVNAICVMTASLFGKSFSRYRMIFAIYQNRPNGGFAIDRVYLR